jgi:hypothetical protein
VWLFILIANIVVCALAVWLYTLWQDKERWFSSIPESLRLDNQVWEVKGTMAAFIIVSIIAVILVLITIAIRKKIKLAIEVVRIASQSISAMPIVCKYFG